jgi:hypothetical protein
MPVTPIRLRSAAGGTTSTVHEKVDVSAVRGVTLIVQRASIETGKTCIK